jgi:hypothetical protein
METAAESGFQASGIHANDPSLIAFQQWVRKPGDLSISQSQPSKNASESEAWIINATYHVFTFGFILHSLKYGGQQNP